ncbi:MAG: SCO family protein [Deltaproteobacteria bacterium]|nr:MAG: SCO family protein [Deltaproteobacteria bacterium]
MRRGFDPIDRISRFLGGSGLPAFALCLLLFYEILLLVLLLTPAESRGLGAFAEDFRVFCFGFDPASGRVDWASVLAMAIPPALLGGFLALVFWQPLLDVLARPRSFARYASAAALVIVAAAAGVGVVAAEANVGELPFPAEALRTAHRAPQLALTNQAGEPVELAALRGHVVALTAVYASCVHTCPAILTQAKRAIGELDADERRDLRVVAVTLDPEHDSPEVLAGLAEVHALPVPLYQLVTGEPAEVERVLDAMSVARRRDPETGVIDHANLFLLLDREGRIAYRLGLGERQERWLISALRVLLREGASAG